jgi:hypothetical protein
MIAELQDGETRLMPTWPICQDEPEWV